MSRSSFKRNQPCFNNYYRLEKRNLLAGDVTVSLLDGQLLILGDDAANEITLSTVAGAVVVAGVDTTVNGTASFTSGANVQNVVLRMNDGDDVVSFEDLEVQNELKAFGGPGNDRFVLDDLIARYIDIKSEAGDDVIDVQDAGTLKSTYFTLGSGDDVVAISRLVTGRNFRVYSGEGADTIAADELHVGKHMYLETLTGDDQVLLAGETNVRKTTGIDLGFGDDSFSITSGENGATAEFRQIVRINTVDGDDAVSLDSGVIQRKRGRLNGGNGNDSINQSGVESNETNTSEFENQTVPNLSQILDSVFESLDGTGIDSTQFGNENSEPANPPELILQGSGLSFTENGPNLNVAPEVVLRGEAEALVESAEVSIVGFQAGQDLLAVDDLTAGITSEFSTTTGVLSLRGNSTLADYQTALRNIVYRNTSESPSVTSRSIQLVVVVDGQTLTGSRTLNVIRVNDAPQLTLPNESLVSTSSELPVTLEPVLTIADEDDTQLESATVSIVSGFNAGDQLTFTSNEQIEGAFDQATGILSLAGVAGIEAYESVLRSVAFDTSSNVTGVRSIEFEINDGDATQAVTMSLEVAEEELEMSVAATPITYTENDSPLVVDADLSLAPPERLVTGATVSIISNFEAGHDVLDAISDGDISVSYNADTGVLTLDGDSTADKYQDVLRTLTYQNSSDDPSAGSREIQFEVEDASGSVMASRTANVIPVDDAIQLVLPSELNGTEPLQIVVGQTYVTDIVATDPDDEVTLRLDLSNSGIMAGDAIPVIDPETGEFMWIPDAAGEFEFLVVAENESRETTSATFELQVVEAA